MNMYEVEYRGGYMDVFANDKDEAWAKVEALGFSPFKIVKYG